MRPPVALYIHFPFCVSLCPYCDFVVIAGSAARGPRNRVSQFVEALLIELELRADALEAAFGPPGTRRRPALSSVYIGGGTPSLLPGDEVARLLAHVRERFGITGDAEITIEANPGPDERGDPAALRAAGVTRMSFGAQSFDDTELRKLGRRHRARQVVDAVVGARQAGIPSVNVDLLYDIPDTDMATWMRTLDAALDLAPDHLSLYALSLDDPIAEGLTGPDGDHLVTTKGARRWRDAVRPGQDEDRAAGQYHHAVVVLEDAGYRGYEISNWARPGHESRHNLAYWERRPHEALGPGAHAFDGRDRRWTAARLDRYIAALAAVPASLPPGGSERIDGGAAAIEALILGLRLDTGVPLAAAHEPPLSDVFGWALAAELLTVTDDDRVVLTTRGRLLSNEVFSRLV
ncbi:MAG TPA: coproporphyrinogen-III oxidase family protein [Candidatus Limnocylindrales bacterium]|nr:coproporphyrinogen-III oxidase family protein [Candidatus Limnocylindrales bacterium]